MNQPGNTDEYGSDPNADKYMASIYAYMQQIIQISQLLNFTPYWEIVSDYGKVKNVELEIADVIYNLETLGGISLRKGFNKRNILRHLNSARVEINIASRLAGATDEQKQALCFEHIVTCREYLNLAIGLMA